MADVVNKAEEDYHIEEARYAAGVGTNLELMDAQKAELAQMKLQPSISPLDNPLQIKAARRNIARLATELRAREINK